MKLSGCGNCKRKSTCLIPDENKIWLQTEPAKETRLVTAVEIFKAFGLEGYIYKQKLVMAIEVLKAFDRAGIKYKINRDGKFDFLTIADLERASEISQEIQKRYLL